MRKRKKLTGGILSVRDFKEGVEGLIGEIAPVLNQHGEHVTGSYDQPLYSLELANLDTGEVQKYWCDGGMRGAITLAKVKPGQAIAVQHTGESTFENDEGKTCRVQTYDVFALEETKNV